jgi:hypothetical protein
MKDDYARIREQLIASTPAVESTRFKPWRINELINSDLSYNWLARGMLLAGTYGQDAGELKTLKSYIGQARHIGLAAGVPILGHWPVEKRTRVLAYVAEGGRISYTRRLMRMCEAHEVDPSDLDGWLVPIFDAAPMDSPAFLDSLRGQLDEYQPGFVHLDPLYPFQPSGVSSSQYTQVGAMLTELQLECAERDAVLWITAHMNQTGSGFDLKRISGAGIGEWGDSWTLTKHREPPRVADGVFKLAVEIGSRQWGGSSHYIDFDIGHFDVDTGTHDGPIQFAVDDPDSVMVARQADDDKLGGKRHQKMKEARQIVAASLGRARRPLKKADAIERAAGIGTDYRKAAFGELLDLGVIVVDSEMKGGNGQMYPLYRTIPNWQGAVE